MDRNSKIFVTGHKGLLGSAVVRRLSAEGFTNLLLADRTKLDLTSQRDTTAFFLEQRPEYVFHCAGRVGGILDNLSNQAEFLYQNLSIQLNVIEASRMAGVKKFLFAGSSCVYPKMFDTPIPEEALLTGPFEPTNEGYAVAKVAGIKLCQYYREQYGLDCISAIPCNLYGQNDRYDLKRSHLLPVLIMKIHQAKIAGDREIVLWGTGKARREFMLSNECADALVFLMKGYSESTPINVGTGEDHTIGELAQAVAAVVGVTLNIHFDPSKPEGMLRKVLNVDRLKQLGWQSTMSLKESIAVAYDGYCQKIAGQP